MQVSLIAAMAQNRVIGANGHLPWHLPEDLMRFRQATLGKPMIMGRVTFDSIGRPLPGRETVILTRGRTEVPGCFLASSWDAAIDKATELASALEAEEIAVVGGEQIYRLAMAHAHRILLTIVHRTVAGDAIFPEIPMDQFQLVATETGRDGGEELSFLEYKRIS